MRSATAFLSILAASALASLPAGAVVQTGHFTTDAEMLALLSDSLFVAEGRIGDRGGAATFELDLGQSTAAPAAQAQYPWQSGQTEPFTLAYDAGSHLVTFTLGGRVLTYVTEFSDFGVIYVRTRAIEDGAAVSVAGLDLDGVALGDAASAAGPGGLDILWITGGAFATGFTLAGAATLSWGSVVPTQSRLAFQIKVARLNVVPAGSATWGGVKNLYR
jgi:hypothetical protein